ncbi:MAG: hypothetical protein AB7F99_08900 [Vicinamibacterales bacterium]
MAVPWLRLLDAAIGVGAIARRVAQGRSAPEERMELSTMSPGGPLEARLAGVVVAALKEAFDRDRQRLDAEREHIEAERQRAERLLRLELVRQAADREINRLRLMAAVAVVSWLVTLFVVPAVANDTVSRVAIGIGWVLLLGALGTALAAQSGVAKTLERIGTSSSTLSLAEEGSGSGSAGAAAPWLIVAGLAAVGAGVLLG